jgi:hypothetical protein
MELDSVLVLVLVLVLVSVLVFGLVFGNGNSFGSVSVLVQFVLIVLFR